MSITLTMTSEPTCTTCSGISTCRSASSEMCTRPSMPSSTRTNAPNGTSLVTLPGTIWWIAWVRANWRHGSSCVAFSDSETRSRSRSTSSTSTSTSWPTSTTSDGWSICSQERSEVDDRVEDALADLALLQPVEELGAHLGLGLLQPGPARQHHVVAVLVQ